MLLSATRRIIPVIMCASVPTKQKKAVTLPAADRASFVTRLQYVVAQWPSADRLAKATGVSPSAFRKWLKGEAEPSRDRVVALAGAAGVSVSWLAQGEGPEPSLSVLGAHGRETPRLTSSDGPSFLVLPKIAVAAAAGAGRPQPESATNFIGFRHDWLKANFGLDPQDILLETVVGDSMEPHIHNGDILLVNSTDLTFRNFGIYVIIVRDERLVKRVQRKFDGSLILISDNAKYQPEIIAPEIAAEINVVGRVIWRGGAI
jgi:phage repressor protein C with HTH and peptisase S24 domain